MREYKRCNATGKVSYTYFEADRQAAALRREKKSNHRAYHCRWCGYHHVGSHTKKSKK